MCPTTLGWWTLDIINNQRASRNTKLLSNTAVHNNNKLANITMEEET